MSTPRTDAATSRHNSSHWLCCDEVVSAEFARGLEAELAAAKADTARLDWLETQSGVIEITIDHDWADAYEIRTDVEGDGNCFVALTLRGAIDKAAKHRG